MFKSNPEIDISAGMTLLSRLNNEELNELLNNDEKFEEMLKDVKQLELSVFKELETGKEMLMASNRSLAEINLSKQPELEESKQSLRRLGERGSELCSAVQEKLSLLKEKSGAMTVDMALDLLQAAATTIEEESEKLADTFLAGDMEVDDFLEQFQTRRNLMHLRKVKVDKMRELMRKPPSRPATGCPGYPLAGGYPAMGPSVPYPTGPVGMPMPPTAMFRPY